MSFIETIFLHYRKKAKKYQVERIRTIDGLRGYGALIIMMAHFPAFGYSALAIGIKNFLSISSAAYLMVDLFFCTSGFLITRIIIAEKIKGTFSFSKFFVRRSLRIFPIYYLTIFIVGCFITWENMGYVATYTSNFFFTFNNNPHPMRHTWSLAVEEHFYLLWPLLFSLVTLATAKRVVSVLFPLLSIAAAFLTYYLVDNHLADTLLFKATPYRILSLASGSYLAFIEKDIISMSKKKYAALCITVLSLFLFITFILHNISAIDFIPYPLRHFLSFSLLSVAVISLVIRMNYSYSKGVVKLLLLNKPAIFLGEMTYGIYLFHYPIIYVLGLSDRQHVGPAEFYICLMAMLVTIVLATLSFYFIEKPILNSRKTIENVLFPVPKNQ